MVEIGRKHYFVDQLVNSNTHSKHRCRKCKKAGSSLLTAVDSVREAGRRLRPFELVTVRGEPFESVHNNIT